MMIDTSILDFSSGRTSRARKKRTLGDRLLNPFSSPYDSQFSDNQGFLDRNQGLAWLAAANAAQQAPSALTAISNALLAGNQAYNSGVENFIAQRNAESDRQLDQGYKRSVIDNASKRIGLEEKKISLEAAGIQKKKDDAAKEEELRAVVQGEIDSLYGSIAPKLEANSIDAAEARLAARRGDIDGLREIADRIKSREMLIAAGVDPDMPGADKVAEDLYRRKTGLGGGSDGRDDQWSIRNYGDGSVWRIPDAPGQEAQMILGPTEKSSRAPMSVEDQAHQMTIREIDTIMRQREMQRGKKESTLPDYAQLYEKNFNWVSGMRDPIMQKAREVLRRNPFIDRDLLKKNLLEETGGDEFAAEEILRELGI